MEDKFQTSPAAVRAIDRVGVRGIAGLSRWKISSRRAQNTAAGSLVAEKSANRK
jgi:hypothetical protein